MASLLLVVCAADEDVFAGRWEIAFSYDDASGDSVFAGGEPMVVDLRRDGSFEVTAGSDLVGGTYAIRRGEEPGLGTVDLLELSVTVQKLGHDSVFVAGVMGDTLYLTSRWTDSWSHVFVRETR